MLPKDFYDLNLEQKIYILQGLHGPQDPKQKAFFEELKELAISQAYKLKTERKRLRNVSKDLKNLKKDIAKTRDNHKLIFVSPRDRSEKR